MVEITMELKPEFGNVKSYYGKARVIKDKEGEMILQSYETLIASYKEGIFKMLCEEDHLTNTTLRHLGEFMQQMGLEKKTKKELVKLL